INLFFRGVVQRALILILNIIYKLLHTVTNNNHNTRGITNIPIIMLRVSSQASNNRNLKQKFNLLNHLDLEYFYNKKHLENISQSSFFVIIPFDTTSSNCLYVTRYNIKTFLIVNKSKFEDCNILLAIKIICKIGSIIDKLKVNSNVCNCLKRPLPFARISGIVQSSQISKETALALQVHRVIESDFKVKNRWPDSFAMSLSQRMRNINNCRVSYQYPDGRVIYQYLDGRVSITTLDGMVAV
ncbi:hypothetical protein AGLY_016455, partial [Aphis glycines]